MTTGIQEARYHRSPPQHRIDDYSASYAWGTFIRFLEFGDDRFALRQVDAFENGYLARYDRVHWTDQFGSLADFRFGKLWVKHWGEPHIITRAEFEEQWDAAGESPVITLRDSSLPGPPPWIAMFESGDWSGQA